MHHVSGSPGSGKSHLAQAIGQAVIQQGYRVLYRETHTLLDELADATLDGTRKEHMELLVTLPLLIIDDLGMRKLPLTAAEDLLEIIMRRYERTSTMLTSNRPVEDWANCWAMRPQSAPCSTPAAPRTCAQVWPAELAHQNRLATTGASRVEQLSPGRATSVGSFELITVGRFSSDHRGLVSQLIRSRNFVKRADGRQVGRSSALWKIALLCGRCARTVCLLSARRHPQGQRLTRIRRAGGG